MPVSSRWAFRLEIADDFFRMQIRREYRIEHVLHAIVCEDERKPLQENVALELERREAEGLRPRSVGIAEQFEREVESPDRFALPFLGVRAHAVHLGPERAKFRMVVSERTRLGRAPAGSGDEIPFLRRGLVRPPRVRIDVDDGRAVRGREIDGTARCRSQGDGWDPHSAEVIARPVVHRDRETGRERRYLRLGHRVTALHRDGKAHRGTVKRISELTLNKVKLANPPRHPPGLRILMLGALLSAARWRTRSSSSRGTA